MRISSVNVTRSAGNCRFGHITEEILKTKKTNISTFGYRLKKFRVGR